jgi:hypothetical protein
MPTDRISSAFRRAAEQISQAIENMRYKTIFRTFNEQTRGKLLMRFIIDKSEIKT